ncbi:hypothetical protein SKAU_G00168250 [Synaphobranchus kaupii]|uniref:Centrosomal protein of 68 kDa n=1 Tax=Synaphobranchus kaupii TaxID=118154 RepID=A0A9Q1J0G2_SYNKA|nr:hypothetical protein SKAU_G00168250 [Synaphobranchus kaupii]
MALGVDRSFPELLSHMEPKSCSRWKTQIPVSTCGSHTSISREGLAQGLPAKSPEKDKVGQKKTVTMAPRSRYLTGKSQYVVRKPLFATGGHISILKKPPLQEHSEQEVEPEQGCSKLDRHSDMERMSCLLAEETPDSCDTCPANASSLSTSGEDLSMPMSTLDLRSWSPHEDTCMVAGFQANMLSPPIDVHSPKWDSTQKSFSLEPYSSSSHFSKRNRVEDSLVQSGDTSLNPRSSLADNKSHPLALHKMSPCQANYWACTIPSCLLPSPDRKSPSWDPDKEYETLLDYTYPLRPNHLPAALDSTDTRSLLRTNPLLLDSGIELDRFCSSSNLSYSDQHLGERKWGLRATEQLSPTPNGHSHSKHYDCRLFGSWYSSVDQIGLSLESLLETDGKKAHCWTHRQKQGIFASGDFIPTSHVLPARRMVLESDEDYHTLPGQLQELQVLSQHLQALSAQVCKSDDNIWESLEKEISSVRKSTTLVENNSVKKGPVEEGGQPASGRPCSQEHSGEVEGLEASLQKLGREVNRCSLREVQSCMGHLSGTSMGGASLSEVQSRMPTSHEDFEPKESLMQHIQEFCSNLEQLIIWLYKVVEKMERLTPPTAEIESVKSSLADYQTFQREVSTQQPLTAAVLHKGGILLSSMDSTAPVLKETLRQIEKQSRALETHAEHLFSSILSAMDSLTEPSSSETEVQVIGPSTEDLTEHD